VGSAVPGCTRRTDTDQSRGDSTNGETTGGPSGRPPPKDQPYTKDIGMEFVRIEPGNFLMGSPDGTNPPGVPQEEGRYVNETPHRVTLTKGYRMSATLVTQYQWEQVMGRNPSKFQGTNEAERKKLPVDSVSWYDCVEFCNELSKKDGKSPCYALANVQREFNKGITFADVTFLPEGTGYRLPTEAEWEYAARAGQKTPTPFWWGNSITPDQANYDGRFTYRVGGPSGAFRDKTTPVDAFPANPWGLHDMGGNLCQWCQDSYGPYEGMDNKDPVRIPKADEDARVRVLRGGAWCGLPGRCRAASRESDVPARHSEVYGCRVVSRLD